MCAQSVTAHSGHVFASYHWSWQAFYAVFYLAICIIFYLDQNITYSNIRGEKKPPKLNLSFHLSTSPLDLSIRVRNAIDRFFSKAFSDTYSLKLHKIAYLIISYLFTFFPPYNTNQRYFM